MASVHTMNTFPQVYVEDESMIKRSDHTITAITISSSLVVVVVFGGVCPFNNALSIVLSDKLSDTVVLEFGEYTIVIKHSVVHVCMICICVVKCTGVLILTCTSFYHNYCYM